MEAQSKITTIIIDDEDRARETIKEMLAIYCPELELIGEANSVIRGIQQIKTLQPDLVFLDIKMPDGTGFDLLNRIDKKRFALIFLTAYDEYAVKAFRFSAIDYLLKPLDPDELITSVDRVKHSLETEKNQLSQLLDNLKSIKKDSKKIILKTAESIFLVNIHDILRCEATGNYTKFFLTNQKPVLVSRTLKEFDDLLSEFQFFRVHQSHLVNLNHIVRLDKSDGGTLIMTDDVSVPVSTRKKESLIKALSEI
ncbi:MAG: LytR/AlgR family response regulator transcription factor [Salinivirgaceae bacterium]